jgi:hypothetical protein
MFVRKAHVRRAVQHRGMRILFAIAVLVIGTTVPASAQDADRAEQIRTSAALNERLLQQVVAGQSMSEVHDLNAQAALALGTAQDLEERLRAALALSTSDGDRSRVNGLLDHTLPVVASLERATTENSLNAAQGQFNQAFGEANEVLNELLPIVPPAQTPPVPAALPNTGSLGGPAVSSLPLLGGLLLIALGALLRRAPRVQGRPASIRSGDPEPGLPRQAQAQST